VCYSPIVSVINKTKQKGTTYLEHTITAGVMPDLVVPAVHSLADGLCCHVATTLWDQLFRQTSVHGCKFVYGADKEVSKCRHEVSV
jgi:hypothetical protein